MYKQIILSKILEYIRLKKIPHKGTKCLNFHCPLCESAGLSANVIPNTAKICCYQCGKGSPRYFNLIDVARKVENLPNATDEEILTLLRNVLNLTVTTQKDETEISVYLDKYAERGWALVPCAKASPMTATEKIFTGKEPIQKEWQKIQNRDKTDWFHWLDSSLNIGVRTGEVSNLCVIDFDFLSKQEKADLVKEGTSEKRIKEINAKKVIPDNIKSIMGETLMQETLGGFHLFYQATDLPKGYIKFGELHIDIETENGQVVIFPSFQTAVVEEYKDGEDIKERIVGYAKRKWLNDLPVAKMPDALYELLKQNKSKKETKIKDEKSDIEEAIITENFKIKDFKNNRHNTMAKVGGILRKNLNILQVKNALSVFNNCVFDEPLPKNEVSLIVDSLDKYIGDEENNIVNNIIEFLNETDIASKSDIELAVFGQKAVSENKLRFEKALTNLILKHKIAKQGLRNYKLVREMKGSSNLLSVGVPINFKMPYFSDIANFCRGDLLLIGGTTKIGKTVLSMNICKRLVEQNLQNIDYFYNESGSRFVKSALKLGLKDGDFTHFYAPNPTEITIRPNSICIYDWVRVSDFSKTADIYAGLTEKLVHSNSIMIAFTQLRENEENAWFAKDLIRQFVALSAKYVYLDKEGINTEMLISDVRDRKSSGKQWKIPCQYNDETKEVQMIEEIDAQEREINRKISVQKDIEDQNPNFTETLESIKDPKSSIPPEVQQLADTIGQSMTDFENFEVK